RTPRTPPPGTLLQPHLALRDGRRPQMPTAVTIDIAVGRRVRALAVARPARRSAVEDEADVDDARDVGVRSLAVPSSKFALGVAAVLVRHHLIVPCTPRLGRNQSVVRLHTTQRGASYPLRREPGE